MRKEAIPRERKRYSERERGSRRRTEITPLDDSPPPPFPLSPLPSFSPKALDQEIGNGLKIHIFSLCPSYEKAKGSGKYFSHVARAATSIPIVRAAKNILPSSSPSPAGRVDAVKGEFGVIPKASRRRCRRHFQSNKSDAPCRGKN